MVRSDVEARRQLGARLRAARLAAGLTQTQAAELLGRGRTSMGAIELGTQDLPSTELAILADAYRVSADALLGLLHIDDIT